MNRISIPDVIPNNLKDIREAYRINNEEMANLLKVEKNFLSQVENGFQNFSGKTTIKILKLYKISFYQLYNVVKEIEADISEYIDKDMIVEVGIPVDDLISSMTNLVSVGIDNLITQSKKTKILQQEIFKKLNGEEIIEDIIVHAAQLDSSEKMLMLKVKVNYKEKIVRPIKYKMDLTANLNKDLLKELAQCPYKESISWIERDVDNNLVKLESDDNGNEYVVFDEEYKIPDESNNIEKFTLSNKVKLGENAYIKSNTIKTKKIIEEKTIIKFKAIRPEINHLKIIREKLNLTVEQMAKALTITKNAYVNIEESNQKLSTKIMLKLVILLRVPFEYIINIEEYYYRYCRFDEKIFRKDVKSSDTN